MDKYTQEQIDNMLNHADFIEGLAVDMPNGKGFDMDFFVTNGNHRRLNEISINTANTCGSVMCAIGWAAHNKKLPTPNKSELWGNYGVRLFGGKPLNCSSGTNLYIHDCFDGGMPDDPILVADAMRETAAMMKQNIGAENA